ncbi:uncharacterized protein [Euphorbia lathyris]|uniref:uncharacterized protein isoform X6 n=1 Tax=Euphorbia lathyris TaxID=212925 RepID=UPI00331329D1
MESLSEAELGEDCRECDMLGLLSVEEMRQQVLRFLNLNCSFVTGSISLSQSLCSIQDTVGVTSLLSERRKLEYVEMEYVEWINE